MFARTLLTIAALLALLVPQARADEHEGEDTQADAMASAEPEEDETVRPGAFLGVSGVYVLENVSNTNGAQKSNSGGISARVGWRWGPYFATEVQTEWLDDFADLGDDGFLITGNGKGYYPIDMFHPYILAGAGFIQVPVDKTGDLKEGFTFRVGMGMELYATDNFVVTFDGQYVAPTSSDTDDADFGVLMAGLMYRF